MRSRIAKLITHCRATLGSDRALWGGRFAVVTYVTALPFSHSAAWKNVGQLLMLLALFYLWRQQRLKISWRSPVWLGLLGLLAVLCLTAVLGTTPIDSFGELRKHFLPGALLLLLVPVTFAEEKALRWLLALIGASFAVRAGLALTELAEYFPDLDAGREQGLFIKGLALDAGFYLFPLLGVILLGGQAKYWAIGGFSLILAAMLLVQSRTPLAAAVLASVLMLLILRRWKVLVLITLVVATLGSTVVWRYPEIAGRLASIVNPATYRTSLDIEHYTKPQDGLAARTAIWHGVLEITAKRAWQGYGFGWKKLGRTAVDDGFVTQWQSRPEDALSAEKAWYFGQPSSKVNPHNLYLQIYFETGLLGLIAYLIYVFVLLGLAARLAWRASGSTGVIAACFAAYLVDHLVLGLANGLWLGGGASFVLLAMLETVRCHEGRA